MLLKLLLLSLIVLSSNTYAATCFPPFECTAAVTCIPQAKKFTKQTGGKDAIVQYNDWRAANPHAHIYEGPRLQSFDNVSITYHNIEHCSYPDGSLICTDYTGGKCDLPAKEGESS